MSFDTTPHNILVKFPFPVQWSSVYRLDAKLKHSLQVLAAVSTELCLCSAFMKFCWKLKQHNQHVHILARRKVFLVNYLR